jgi:hypothetical protein
MRLPWPRPQASLRRRILRAFVGRGLLENFKAKVTVAQIEQVTASALYGTGIVDVELGMGVPISVHPCSTNGMLSSINGLARSS